MVLAGFSSPLVYLAWLLSVNVFIYTSSNWQLQHDTSNLTMVMHTGPLTTTLMPTSKSLFPLPVIFAQKQACHSGTLLLHGHEECGGLAKLDSVSRVGRNDEWAAMFGQQTKMKPT